MFIWDINTLFSLLFTTKFSSARQLKNYVELFFTFLDESRLSQMQNLKKKTDKNPLNTVLIDVLVDRGNHRNL